MGSISLENGWEFRQLKENNSDQSFDSACNYLVLVGVKTSVLVWQGLGSTACAKGKNQRGLKAVQYFGVVFALRNIGLAAPPTSDFVLGSVPVVSLSPHSPSTIACAPVGPPQERAKGGKRRCRLDWSPQSHWLNTLIDFGHYRFSSILSSCFSFPCGWVFPPGHPPSPCHMWSCTSKSLPAGYFWTEKQSKLPAWMLLFEPCALKHGQVLWLFLTHSSSRAAFSGAMKRNV